MKIKKRNGKVSTYNHRNFELNQDLRKCGYKVQDNKKKALSKKACRTKGGFEYE